MKCSIDRNVAVVRLTKVTNFVELFITYILHAWGFVCFLHHGVMQFYFERAICEQTTRVAPPEGFFKLVYELNAWATSAVLLHQKARRNAH